MPRKEISFDRPPSGFTRRGQQQGALIVAKNPQTAQVNKLQEKLELQAAQIAELKAMVEEMGTKKGKK
jgi:hypothetical protein